MLKDLKLNAVLLDIEESDVLGEQKNICTESIKVQHQGKVGPRGDCSKGTFSNVCSAFNKI